MANLTAQPDSYDRKTNLSWSKLAHLTSYEQLSIRCRVPERQLLEGPGLASRAVKERGRRKIVLAINMGSQSRKRAVVSQRRTGAEHSD
jgi:hypothetical protein